jgi:uncharacterized protein (DUF2141 family)
MRHSGCIQIKPKTPLAPNQAYKLMVRVKYFSDLSGNAVQKDSVRKYVFHTIDPERFGSIEGTVAAKNFRTPAAVVITNINDRRFKPRSVKVGNGSKFSFPLLPEGKYQLKAFDDINGNMRHDVGRVFPFQPSERFIFPGDTIKVRARWPIDGVLLRE